MRRSLVRPTVLALALVLWSIQAEAREAWRVLKNCREVPNESNDGDSFHVRAENQEYIFRLYFVDAPETDSSFPARVGEQAKYFGITQTQALQLGDYAKHYTHEQLNVPFTVRTCMQDALGRSVRERFYAFIETHDGDLAELLVANGMARVHGSTATPVGLNSPERERRKLEQLERDAKTAKVGGWGAKIGRLTARLPKQPSKTGPDSFDAFFHPERLANEAATPAERSPAAPGSASLDPNSASAAELIAIPGIGPVLAGRIMAARPFTSADDLRRVKGIGEKTFARIRPFFTPAPEAAPTTR